MLYRVELKAVEIQTEAEDEQKAFENAREDAAEFYGDWTYVFEGAELVDHSEDDVAPTASVDDMEISVDLVGDEDGLYTFDGWFTLIVEAPDETTAEEIALGLPKSLRYGEAPSI